MPSTSLEVGVRLRTVMPQQGPITLGEPMRTWISGRVAGA